MRIQQEWIFRFTTDLSNQVYLTLQRPYSGALVRFWVGRKGTLIAIRWKNPLSTSSSRAILTYTALGSESCEHLRNSSLTEGRLIGLFILSSCYLFRSLRLKRYLQAADFAPSGNAPE